MSKKYRFEITYSNPSMQDVADFMNRLDLGIHSVIIKHVMTFTSTRNLPPSRYREAMERAYKEAGCKIWLIEGHEVE